MDKRTDIWAFGVVLFEMLTGTPPFPGDDVSHVLARVIERDPDWSALPATLPASLTLCLIVVMTVAGTNHSMAMPLPLCCN